MKNILTIYTLLFVFGLMGKPSNSFCQSITSIDKVENEKKPLFEIFQHDKRTEIVLTANYDSIKANRRSTEYEDGIFEIKHTKKVSTKLKVKLRPRGKSRRMMCDFPPLKIKFKKESLDSNGLQKFNEFKLVTHCKDGEGNEINVLREYLVYKLYNVLTPYSFNTALVNVTYKNLGSSFNKIKQIGIIIEDPESLAKRNSCQTMSNKVIQLDSLHFDFEKITSVFQYMVGNADWSYLMARNTELIQMEDGQVIAVPYDFDYAGLVSAPYARANKAIGQQTVRDRVFLGNATEYEQLAPCFQFFKSKKEELLQTVEDFDELDPAIRREMKDYLNGFFEIIDDRTRVEDEMLARVKKG